MKIPLCVALSSGEGNLLSYSIYFLCEGLSFFWNTLHLVKFMLLESDVHPLKYQVFSKPPPAYYSNVTICYFSLQNEMASLKADNQRLQKLVGPASPDENTDASVEKQLSIGDPGPALGIVSIY